MFTVSVKTSFKASHQLDLPDGSKENDHTHDWFVKVDVRGNDLDDYNLLIDFVELKKKLNAITAQFEGKKLEKLDFFAQNNASAECVARYIYEKIETMMPKGVKLKAVEVTEEPGCSVKYNK